jgi:hypothetical protein
MKHAPVRAPSIPPEVPMSTNRMPFSAKLACLRRESIQCELPPSTRMSSSARSPSRSVATRSVISPWGT